MKIKKSTGFTLVELLIVIIIIGVLAGGLLLSVGGSDKKAKEAACLGTAKDKGGLVYINSPIRRTRHCRNL